MDINGLLEKIIENKYRELNFDSLEQGRFCKIRYFEGNAIGQIGENFVKQLFRENAFPLDEDKGVVHDEYDILSKGKKIEIKTARKGLKNNTFQFNGINPSYNHDLIILLGLTADNAYYKILDGKATYDHQKRKYFLKVDSVLKQLVAMNPGNSVNYKLTLSLKVLKPISFFIDDLRVLLAK